MSKRLVVCCDGTWNTPETETHIRRIYEGCGEKGDDGLRQEKFYLKGVGTGTIGDILCTGKDSLLGSVPLPVGHITGGAVGAGLSHNVRAAYSWVRDNHEPGDELFIFGFSRGAYTARSLAGFLGLVGRLRAPEHILPAYFWYRLRGCSGKASPARKEGLGAFGRFIGGHLDTALDTVVAGIADRVGEVIKPWIKWPIPVTFLGVFDTVGALGLPFHAEELGADLDGQLILGQLGLSRVLGATLGNAAQLVRTPIEGFHSTELGDNVANAYHALAIDERRRAFLPTPWSAAPAGTNVEQRWFAGVHGDVGGGYYKKEAGEERLSSIPLAWMLKKATDLKLGLNQAGADALQPAPGSELTPQHDSLNFLFTAVGHLPAEAPVDRPIGNVARTKLNAEKGFNFELVRTPEVVDPSVGKRWGQDVFEIAEALVIAETSQTICYTPRNLALDATQLDTLKGGQEIKVL